MGRTMTSVNGRSLACLLPEPGLMPQLLSSGVLDVHPAYHDSTESVDPLLGVVKLTNFREVNFFNFFFSFPKIVFGDEKVWLHRTAKLSMKKAFV